MVVGAVASPMGLVAVVASIPVDVRYDLEYQSFVQKEAGRILALQ